MARRQPRRQWPSPVLLLAAVLAVFARTAAAAVIEHNFNITWVWADPDGQRARPVIGVNGVFPPPALAATVGDTVVINTWNSLGNQSTSLHFHGIYMNTTSHMDGTAGVSQCSIRPGESFTYRFRVDQPGTYWYHSHTTSQYPDGLRGMLVIADTDSPYVGQYSDEIVLSLSDWYHDQMVTLLDDYDTNGGDPEPDSIMINDTTNVTVAVKPGTTYLVRVANIAAYVGIYFWIEGHVMRIVEADGVWTQPAEATLIYLAAGQRHSFLLTTRPDAQANFAMVARMDPELQYLDESERAVGWLTYDDQKPFPDAKVVEDFSGAFDDMALVPYDQQPVLGPEVGQSITLAIGMGMAMDGGHHWRFNSSTYQTPSLPTLFSALDEAANVTDPDLYGKNSQPIVLAHNQVTELVIINKHPMDHPVHLHGHSFQILQRTAASSRQDVWAVVDPNATPVRRDTVLVRSGGAARIRFVSDNPGVWLLHCHMEWHSHSGLVATIIEAPEEIQRQGLIKALPVGTDSKRVCEMQDVRPAMEWHEIVELGSGVKIRFTRKQ
ncbi:Cupredoxin [Microdochium trichocladiopsis]|uniref:Cupredoxin n=1 Tax=Microdochium trichocladiopsis TaxID=1682393 RepID=A0A9P9BL62_9PEZI|nr:Cupredoxin [Microdochium trichocladiopsis]KAH7024597.1 Cupredoxin [Microdochium trichocladiopsis]